MPFSLGPTRRPPRAARDGGTGEARPTLAIPPWVRGHAVQAVLLVVVMALAAVPGAQVIAPTTEQARADKNLDDLKKKAKEAEKEVEKATDNYVKRKEKLGDAQDDLVGTLEDLEDTEDKLADMREPLSQLASTMYQQPDGGALAMMTSGSIEKDLQAESYVGKLSEDQKAVLHKANKLRDKQSELAGDAQDLQADTQYEKIELKDDLKGLKKDSKNSTDDLTSELKDRGLDVGAYMAGMECDASKGKAAKEHPNGLLPKGALCELPQGGEFLRADAAVDFMKMNEAYEKKFGKQMSVNSSYRDRAKQQSLYASKPPGQAAEPGTSNHGWGLAVDLGGGVQSEGSEQFTWLEQNSKKWGWFHPEWAYSSPFEPWHWEYKAAKGE